MASQDSERRSHAAFGEAMRNPPCGGTSGVKPPKPTMDGEDLRRLAATFGAHMAAEAKVLEPDNPARAWLLGLVALAKAVASTADQLKDQP